MSENNKHVFLATTALEEFWDATKSIVFMGEGCRLYGRRLTWEQLDGKVLDNPSCAENNKDVYLYKQKIYEKALQLLGESLNSVHGINYSNRSWRIILGPWLFFYITAVYDRYRYLKSAMEQYPDFTTIVLSEESFVIPDGTNDFIVLVSEDAYNLQIYSKILSIWGKIFPSREFKISRSLAGDKIFHMTWMGRAVGCILKRYAELGSKILPLVILKNSYFNKEAELDIFFKTRGRTVPLRAPMAQLPSFQPNKTWRETKRYNELGYDEFEKCLSKMMFSDIPKCFVEGFGYIKNHVRKNYPKKVKAIFSANSWYPDEAFKLWAAESSENGALLLGSQHGGNYGGMANMFWEDHETAIVDSYYTWGWERTDCSAKVVPLPANKLVNRRNNKIDNQKKGILWVATSNARYLYDPLYCSSINSLISYYSWQCRFGKTLSSEVVAVCRFRAHTDDHEWDVYKRLKECVSDLQLETWEIPFLESLGNCSLYVCDHFSTTFIEALSSNTPTVLFWNPKYNELRPEAEPYFELLYKNGILFYTPEDAAEAINCIYSDIESWWNNPERQAAVKAFCEKFARTSPEAVELWANELNRVANAII